MEEMDVSREEVAYALRDGFESVQVDTVTERKDGSYLYVFKVGGKRVEGFSIVCGDKAGFLARTIAYDALCEMCGMGDDDDDA